MSRPVRPALQPVRSTSQPVRPAFWQVRPTKSPVLPPPSPLDAVPRGAITSAREAVPRPGPRRPGRRHAQAQPHRRRHALDVQPQLRDRPPRRASRCSRRRRSPGRTSSSRTSGSSPARRTSACSRSTAASSGTRGPTRRARCRARTATSGGTSRCTTPRDAPPSTTRSRGCVEELKRNPMSRRLVVTAWAPGNAQTREAAAVPPALRLQRAARRERRSAALPAPHAAQRRRRARRAVQHRRLRAAARALLALQRHPRGHLRPHDDRRARLHGQGRRLDGRVRPRARPSHAARARAAGAAASCTSTRRSARSTTCGRCSTPTPRR